MELQEYLDQEEQVNESFQIDNDQTANWALRKIKSIKQQIQQNDNLSQAEIEKIESWAKRENDKLQQSIDYFQGLLGKYAMEKRKSDPKFKSQALPHGRIKFVKQQPKWNYDDKKLLESLKQNKMSSFIRNKEEPDKTRIKNATEVVNGKVIEKHTGEIIEGITVEEREEAFKVEVDDE